MSQLTIHIGMPKAASSLLQQQALPQLEAGGHLRFLNIQRWTEPVRRLLYEPEERYQPSSLRQALPALDRPTVITNEALSGDFGYKTFNRTATARKLWRTFPVATVVLVLRAQPKLALSAYAQHVHQGGTMTLRDYLRFDGGAFPAGYKHNEYRFGDHRFWLPALDYAPLLDAYAPFAEAGRLRVLLFESIKDGAHAFLARFLAAAGVDPALASTVDLKRENSSFNTNQIRVARRLNRLTLSPYNPFGLKLPRPWAPSEPLLAHHVRRAFQSGLGRRLVPGPKVADSTVTTALEKYFAPLNRALAERIPDEYQARFAANYFFD